ncbi:UDP-D-xylose:L-fucose alpha-1,3-D-xylosyltransferase MGP4-like [Iris pallida]|uniref:Glycosyltransferase n=1 Tax=Iris pallida TaxID=29817 RepID=A0AAX6G612_IRIPA|nr:UDP-D-xylose:L-fucose alpha-1,3-D-xylosyltransferase MGP4-like [Iris pallida]
MATSLLHQRQKPPSDPHQISPRSASSFSTFNLRQRTASLFGRAGLLLALLPLLLLLFLLLSSSSPPQQQPFSASRWRDYTLADAASFAANGTGTVIVCAVSQPYLPFLANWLIGVSRQRHQDKVLVIAEDYATLYAVNRRWPGHAVLVPPAPDAQSAHKFGSQGFFNFTSRRPRHLLNILELGYSVMYNDVDMVWLGDPFQYLKEKHDVYFTDDMTAVKPLDHPHSLPPPGKKGRTYICSCMIYLRPTNGAKLVMKKWIEELTAQPWSKKAKANDQPAFNWALNKTAGQVDLYLCLRLHSHLEVCISRMKHG